MLRPDGALAYHDAAAAGSFNAMCCRCCASLPDGSRSRRRLRGGCEHCAQLRSESGVAVWDFLPGVFARGVPYVEKRQAHRRACFWPPRAESFRLGEERSARCSRLGVDGIWLSQQAESFPATATKRSQRQARLLLCMVRDQVRLGGLEHELDSLSAPARQHLRRTEPDLSALQRHADQPPRQRLLQAGVPGCDGSDQRARHGRGTARRAACTGRSRCSTARWRSRRASCIGWPTS